MNQINLNDLTLVELLQKLNHPGLFGLIGNHWSKEKMNEYADIIQLAIKKADQ